MAEQTLRSIDRVKRLSIDQLMQVIHFFSFLELISNKSDQFCFFK